MSKEPERKVEDIKSVFCRCQKVQTITTDMMDGWSCACDVLFKDDKEERFFFDHIGIMRELSKEEREALLKKLGILST
jgi:hypothetical protein